MNRLDQSSEVVVASVDKALFLEDVLNHTSWHVSNEQGLLRVWEAVSEHLQLRRGQILVDLLDLRLGAQPIFEVLQNDDQNQTCYIRGYLPGQ